MAEDDSFAVSEFSLNDDQHLPFAVGQFVMAQYMEDSEWYRAEIIEHDEIEDVFVVVFTEYGNEQECTVDMLQHIAGDDEQEEERAEAARKQQEAKEEEERKKKAAAAKKPPAKRASAAVTVDDPFGEDVPAVAPKKKAEPVAAPAAKKSPEPPRKSVAAAEPAAAPTVKKSPEPPRKSVIAPPVGRREAAEKRRKQGKGKPASSTYDDDESVLHGVDDIDAIVETAEGELFASLDKLEKSKSGQDLVMLASTLSELAVLPCTPASDAKELWNKALGAASRALQADPESTGVMTQSAHLLLRSALYLAASGDGEGAELAFQEAATKYRSVFDLAPVRIVLKYIVLALSRAPSINLHHFLGLFDNGYSRALMRSQEEKTYNQIIEHHVTKLSELSFAGVAYPLFRAHCFGVLRMVVVGMAIAVTDDLPEDQAALLLHAWDSMVRLEKGDEASLLGLYLLKLNDEADIGILAEAIAGIREYVVRCNYDKLAETVADVDEDGLMEMANTELEEVLMGMSEYDPNEVLRSMRGMQADLLQLEVKQAGPTVSLALRDVDLEDLFAVARDRFELSQFFAARTYAGLLQDKASVAKVTQAICADANGPRLLAFLCVNDNPATSKVAAEALALVAENAKKKADLEPMGLVEAAVYLLSHPTLSVVASAVGVLSSLSSDEACKEAIMRVRKQLGPALLDQVFCSDTELVKAIACFVIKFFGVSDKDSATDFAIEMIPDIIQEDLDDVVEVLARELPKKKLAPAAPKKEAAVAPPPSKKEAPVASAASKKAPLEKGKPEKEVVRGRGFTQQIEAKFNKGDFGDTEILSGGDSENDEVHLDPEAQEELERELAGMDDFDEGNLSHQSMIEAQELEDTGEDARIVALLKMGAALEDQVDVRLDENDVDGAEDLVDQAIVKYQLLLKLSPNSHIGLRRMADALLRKAEFRDGGEADELYARAIELYDKDIAVHDVEESYSHKVQAMIDRAKNKAAEEEPKGVFTVTRKLLAEAKQAAGHVKERDSYVGAINEVLTYCRLQADAKKEASKTARESTAKPSSGGSQALSPKAPAKASDAAPKAVAPQAVKPPTAVKAAAPALSAKPTAPKATNPDAILRKGSVLVTQKKAGTTTDKPSLTASGSMTQKKGGQAAGEKERLQAALAAKKPMSKVGKLFKEGGGKSLLGRKTWKERLFELSESSLEYYEKSNKTEKPKGAISLYEVTTARSVTMANKSYCFEVVTESRKFPIQAQSDTDKEEWIKVRCTTLLESSLTHFFPLRQ